MKKMLIDVIKTIGRMLDDLNIAICLFDKDNRTVLWNRTFLNIFPEHADHVHEGEHYRDNLRRFYTARLTAEEMPLIEQYVEAGINRHQQQNRSFVFTHHSQSITASSLVLPLVGRLRMWRGDAIGLASPATSTMHDSDTVEDKWAQFDVMLNRIPDGLMVCSDTGTIQWANVHFAELYGLPDRNMAMHTSFDFIYRLAWSNSRQVADPTLYQTDLDSIRDNVRFAGAPFELALPDERYVRVTSTPASHGEIFYTHVDITHTKRQEMVLKIAERETRSHLEEIRTLASRDTLTGLANRMASNERLERNFSSLCQCGAAYGVLIADLDNFKGINDGFGHLIGDDVLQSVARLLTPCLDSADFAARIGGEEFLIIIEGGDGPALIRKAEAIRRSVASYVHPVAGKLTISIGAALASALDPSPMMVVQKADHCLYEAKRNGRNRVILSEGAPAFATRGFSA